MNRKVNLYSPIRISNELINKIQEQASPPSPTILGKRPHSELDLIEGEENEDNSYKRRKVVNQNSPEKECESQTTRTNYIKTPTKSIKYKIRRKISQTHPLFGSSKENHEQDDHMIESPISLTSSDKKKKIRTLSDNTVNSFKRLGSITNLLKERKKKKKSLTDEKSNDSFDVVDMNDIERECKGSRINTLIKKYQNSPQLRKSLRSISWKDFIPHLVDLSDGWIIDTFFNDKEDMNDFVYKEELFYNIYFAENEHINYVGKDGDCPIILSAKQHNDDTMVIYRTPFLSIKKIIPVKNPGKKSILKNINISLKSNALHKSKNNNIVPQLMQLEKSLVVKQFKFGILYAKSEQKIEEEMFSNEHGSNLFNEFIDFIGDRISLQGWNKYSGGLDVSKNKTGLQSIFTTHNDCEIMFHVSTLLPYSTTDSQQLERKRHLGNDIVVIVFVEGNNARYVSSTISSHFNHILCIIHPVVTLGITSYRLQIATRTGVAPFGPTISPVFTYQKDDAFRNLLLCKLINGELSAYKAPELSKRLCRTNVEQMNYIIENFK